MRPIPQTDVEVTSRAERHSGISLEPFAGAAVPGGLNWNVDSSDRPQTPHHHRCDGSLDDVAWIGGVLRNAQGYLPGSQHPRDQPGLVLPRDVRTGSRKTNYQYNRTSRVTDG